MTADTRAPAALRSLQGQLSAAFRTPPSFTGGRMVTASGAYPAEAVRAVAAADDTAARGRLAVYNQQYWYRLLHTLQEDYPLLARTLTPWEFNRLAVEYLTAFPSHSPLLQHLGDGLPAFLAGAKRWSRPRSLQIAALDRAFFKALHAPWEDPAPEGAALRLQAHVTVFEEDWNLVETRHRCVEQGGPSDSAPPSYARRKGWWMISRNGPRIAARPLSRTAYRLLSGMAGGTNLERAFSRLLSQLSPRAARELEENVAGWFAEWTRLGLFSARD